MSFVRGTGRPTPLMPAPPAESERQYHPDEGEDASRCELRRSFVIPSRHREAGPKVRRSA